MGKVAISHKGYLRKIWRWRIELWENKMTREQDDESGDLVKKWEPEKNHTGLMG